MKVKELVDELKKYDWELDVYFSGNAIRSEVEYWRWEQWADVEDMLIDSVRLDKQVYFHKEDEPCIILWD